MDRHFCEWHSVLLNGYEAKARNAVEQTLIKPMIMDGKKIPHQIHNLTKQYDSRFSFEWKSLSGTPTTGNNEHCVQKNMNEENIFFIEVQKNVKKKLTFD